MPRVEVLLHGFSLRTDQGHLGLSSTVLIAGRRRTLVDPGPHGRRELLLQALERRGLGPDDIEVVVLTHAHWDHVQNLDLFPQAVFLIHPEEVEYARDPRRGDWATARYFPRMLEGLRVEPVRGGGEIEPGVTVVETPGHTRGHISLLVETPSGTVAVSGDALAEAGAPARGKPTLIFWDEAQAEASVRRLLEASRTFYPGHDRPFRVGEGLAVTYLAGPQPITLMGDLGSGPLSVTLGPGQPRQVWVLR